MGWGMAALETGLNVLGAIPAVGEVVSAGETAYHGTTALLDYASGDTHGAEHSLVSAGNAAIGMIPGFGEGYHGVHAVANGFQLGQRLAGASDEEAPTVNEAMTGAIFGSGGH